VLPVDVNVRRVQERTGHDFDHTCAQALMDLGATVCTPAALRRSPRPACPRAAALSPAQGPFEGRSGSGGADLRLVELRARSPRWTPKPSGRWSGRIFGSRARPPSPWLAKPVAM
jgi:hypothetical protein